MTWFLPLMLEVSAAMAVRSLSVCAAAVFAAAVAVWAVVRVRVRRVRREVVSERLMAGCAARDNVALRGQLEVFRARLEREVAAGRAAGPASGPAPVSSSASVSAVPSPRGPSGARPCPSVPRFPVSSSSEGGPQ